MTYLELILYLQAHTEMAKCEQTALAQPEQEPSQWREMVVATLVREGINKHKARELADHFAAQPPAEWEAINNIIAEYGLQAIDFVADWKATLGQAEPVAWMSSDRAWMWSDYSKAIAAVANIPTLTLIPLYAAPAQRPWQGLTPEEVKRLYPYGRSIWGKETFEAIEKALKDKNT